MQSTTAAHRSEGSHLFVLTATVLIASLMLGGGTKPGFLADALMQAIALPLLLATIWLWPGREHVGSTPAMRVAIGFCIGLVALHLVQLIPLPPGVWARLGDRTGVVAAFEALGREPGWQPLTVSPRSTWLSLLALMPSVAIFLAVLHLGYRERRMLSLAVVAFAAASALLGLVQIAQGPASMLRPFSITNDQDATALFANRNHFAALIYTGLLLLAVWSAAAAIELVSGDSKRIPTGVIAGALACFVVLLAMISALSMSRSRGGLGLTILALLGGLLLPVALTRANGGTLYSGRISLLAIAAAFVFAGQYALYRVLERLTLDPLNDARLPYARNTFEAALANMPFGSGIGTFVPVYASRENPADVMDVFANRAHNDFLEVWLETGIAGIVLAGVLVGWLAFRMIRVWREGLPGAEPVDNMLARAATLAVALLLLHSIVDYPLRTGAMAAIMALACALALPPLHRAEPRAKAHAGRQRSRSRKPVGAEPITATVAAAMGVGVNATASAAASAGASFSVSGGAEAPTPPPLPRLDGMPPLPRLDTSPSWLDRPPLPRLDGLPPLPRLDPTTGSALHPNLPPAGAADPPAAVGAEPGFGWPAPSPSPAPPLPGDEQRPERQVQPPQTDSRWDGFDWPESWRKKPGEQ